MKIKISEKEFYVIELDKDEISPEEFSGFMNRLRIIEKILNKSDIEESHHKHKHNNRGQRVKYPWLDNKAELIKALKIYYSDKPDRKDILEKSTGKSWSDITKNLFYNRKKYNIKPKELGLNYYPSGRGKSINVKQAKMKGNDYD